MLSLPVLAAALASAPPASATWLDGTGAVLQALDKVTARVWRLEVPLDRPTRFGTLEIVVSACRKHPPDEEPEAAGYLQITDLRPGNPARRLFKGWMFASSPALSALEHPVYDVWVVDCRVPAAPAEPKPPGR